MKRQETGLALRTENLHDRDIGDPAWQKHLPALSVDGLVVEPDIIEELQPPRIDGLDRVRLNDGVMNWG